MENRAAKKHPRAIVWLQEGDISTQLHPLPVEAMWGLKKRALVLREEFRCNTIGDVARLSPANLRKRFGVWGDVISRWANGGDVSPINSDNIASPQKGYSNRTTLPRDYCRREEICAIILERVDEVCRRLRTASQEGRRIGLGLTYASFAGGFHKEKTIRNATNQENEVYSVLLHLLERWWNRTPVRAVDVSISDLKLTRAISFHCKRTAFLSLLQFLSYNGYTFVMDPKQAEDFVVDVVIHKYTFEQVVSIIESHSH